MQQNTALLRWYLPQWVYTSERNKRRQDAQHPSVFNNSETQKSHRKELASPSCNPCPNRRMWDAFCNEKWAARNVSLCGTSRWLLLLGVTVKQTCSEESGSLYFTAKQSAKPGVKNWTPFSPLSGVTTLPPLLQVSQTPAAPVPVPALQLSARPAALPWRDGGRDAAPLHVPAGTAMLRERQYGSTRRTDAECSERRYWFYRICFHSQITPIKEQEP